MRQITLCGKSTVVRQSPPWFAANLANFCGQIVKSATVWRSPLAADFLVDRGRLWRSSPDSGRLLRSPLKLEFNRTLVKVKPNLLDILGLFKVYLLFTISTFEYEMRFKIILIENLNKSAAWSCYFSELWNIKAKINRCIVIYTNSFYSWTFHNNMNLIAAFYQSCHPNKGIEPVSSFCNCIENTCCKVWPIREEIFRC